MKMKKKSFFETVETEVLHEAQDYVRDKIAKRALKIGEMSSAFLLGFILLIIGVAEFLESAFPILDGGFNYLLLGVLFILVGMLLR